MPRKCQLTGKGTATGNNVSHSHKKTRRVFKANVQRKRVYLEEEKRWVTVNLSTRALRTMRKKGVRAMLQEANLL
ncbi:MAG: 50S ribosomal protein L28 [Leptospiraceae bacterium]|nr:50S ribosomal protein L28 [Leptospiraceae bacterium]MCB1200323.1 50S ribosomal protein L28 [Leptospiraceae bacterium]